jgi:hypothetical protein
MVTEYIRYKPLLGTSTTLGCSFGHCEQPAILVHTCAPPAGYPYCAEHNYRGDGGCGTLMALDHGIWRATAETWHPVRWPDDWRPRPFDFDW